MGQKNSVTTVYIDDYSDDIASRLSKIEKKLEERDTIISEISEKKHNFLMKRKEGIKEFLDSRDYYPAKNYTPGSIHDSFYCERNSHNMRLYVFDFILILITSGESYTQYKINIMVNEDQEEFEQIKAIRAREGRVGFLDLEKIDLDFLEEELRKLEKNVSLLKNRLDTFLEEELIYNYEDIYSKNLNVTLNKILNETKI